MGTIWYGRYYLEFFDFSGKSKWRIDFKSVLPTTEPKLGSGIRILDNIMYLVVKDTVDWKASFIAVDCLEGNILFKQEDFGGHLRVIDNKLISVSSTRIAKFDTSSLKWTIYDASKSLSDLDEEVKEFASNGEFLGTIINQFSFSHQYYDIKDDYFIFAQARSNKVGIINLITNKIEWTIDMGKEFGSGLVIQVLVSDNYIYILDSDRRLFTFSKEISYT